MLRKLALSLAIAGVLGVPNAHALGLGELNIKSALNEPLSAEIRLIEVGDLSALQIQPRMADADEFSIAGLTRSRFLNNVRFQVEVMPNGEGVIRITSNEPVREPFLNFLLDVGWPNGRLVREYTLLLDPPVFDSAPIGGQVQQAVTTAPAPAASIAPAPSRTDTAPRAERPAQVRVGANDTLWELATRHRPDRSVTPQQMMVALQRHNPQTFPTGNINVIRAGTVMSIPSIEQIRELTAAEASAEVTRQTEAWRESRARPATPSPQPQAEPEVAQPEPEPEAAEQPETDVQEEVGDVSEPEADTASATEELSEQLAEAELRIVTPEPEVLDEDQASPVIGDAVSGQEEQVAAVADGLLQRTDNIENNLVVALETIDKIERENRDLNDRLDAIQEQLALMQRMLELKDQQIAALQTAQSQSGLLDKVASVPVVGGLLAALIAALLALFFSRRRKNTQPQHAFTVPESASAKHVAASAAAGAGAVAVADAVASDDEPEQEPELATADSSDTSNDDFSDLDLDLDLDLDEGEDDVRVVDEEYDLAAENEYGNLFEEPDLNEASDAEDSFDTLSDEPQSQEESMADDVPSYDNEIDFESFKESDDEAVLEDNNDAVSAEPDSLENLLGADDDLSELSTEDDEQIEFSSEEEQQDDSDELENLLDSIELEDDEQSDDEQGEAESKKPGEKFEEELTANIVHDLEMDLDDELDGLLSSADDDIALEESQSSEEAIDMLDSLNLLDGADENETKLDLARAYLEMDDAEGAREILGEILGEGNDKQKEEAQKLLDSLS